MRTRVRKSVSFLTGLVASIQRVAARISAATSLRSTPIDGGMYGAFSSIWPRFSHSNPEVSISSSQCSQFSPVNPAATRRPLRAIAIRRSSSDRRPATSLGFSLGNSLRKALSLRRASLRHPIHGPLRVSQYPSAMINGIRAVAANTYHQPCAGGHHSYNFV